MTALTVGFAALAAVGPSGALSGLPAGIAVALSGLLDSAWCPAFFASVQIRRAGNGPLRMMRFLEDARARGVLRTAGPVYQFRHARLQDRLARDEEPDQGRTRAVSAARSAVAR
ncbi:hypothetical protein J5X84_24055 [Streptosporangiaceae bacterium NEAU-GS5]|nr:hypothetical protein [Streptosporangiaceae bacterium NEAU-GS5]